jgi:hypothetical protein
MAEVRDWEMDNMKRIRIYNILREMESEIRRDTNLNKYQALDLILALDRLWDELKGDSQVEEKLQRAAAGWSVNPRLNVFSQKLREQLFQA